MIRKTCAKLREEYIDTVYSSGRSEKLKLITLKNELDIYNITAPFAIGKKSIIAGRVEARDSENSHIVFFEEQSSGGWIEKEENVTFELQDPFVTFISGELILGGVEVFPHPANPENLWWKTVFYRGKTLKSLKKFAEGPCGMKDIRLLGLNDGRVLVFTRPQGEKGGRGQIGCTIIDSIEKLSAEAIARAPLLPPFFFNNEWGGVNEAQLLKNGKVGVLAHIACFDESGDRHYYSSAFCFDYSTQWCSPMKIIAIRANFESGEAKRPDLADVLFSGGLVRNGDGTADLFCGVSDAEAHKIAIEDPFLEYEQL